jgi:hypothetical protein
MACFQAYQQYLFVCIVFGNSEVLLVSMFGETREIDQEELAAKSLCEPAIALYASMTFAVH